jgi:death-on-curing protein
MIMTSFISCLKNKPIFYLSSNEIIEINLSSNEIIEINKECIEQYGGSRGVRDKDMLDSAVGRPKTGYYPSIIEQAAALLESLLMNHPFIDGNKRTSFLSTYTFLKKNNLILYIKPLIAEKFLCNYSHKKFPILVRCLEENVDLLL